MTSATERIRALLDERGVEYRTHGTTDRTWFEVGHISWFIHERENGNFTADAVFLTPEQAIAATLGRGMLTAEQVRGVLLLHLPHREYYSIEQTDGWQAIADELNSTLGSFNCTNDCANSERTTTVDETWHVGFNMWNGERVTIHVMECNKCGRTYEHVNGNYEFCPRCGRKVVTE